MADRTSAELFSVVFELLAENPTEEHKVIAHKLWPHTWNYDFGYYQMYCDEALIKLDLARERVDPDEPEEGPVMFYGPIGDDTR